MRILLINPLLSLEKIYGKFKHAGGIIPPLGLAYIASILERDNHNVRIIDCNTLIAPLEDTLEQVDDFLPDLIGWTVTTNNLYEVNHLAQKIKILYPNIPLVIGGPHLVDGELQTLEGLCFDYGVIGEGEYTMRELVQKIESGDKNLRDIKGLIFKENREIIPNSPREPIVDLDRLPFPARHLFPPMSRYRPKIISYRKLPCVHIFTSKGCPYKCIFCRTPFGKKVRFHSPEYVVSEIKHVINKYGAREIIFIDDTFIITKERVFQICKLIQKNDIKIPWSCDVRADLVDKNLLFEMKKAGCWLIFVGLESGNQMILDTLKKNITLEQAENTCKWAEEIGLFVRASFILGNPNETLDTIEETIKFAKKLPIHYPMFTFMTPYPGTDLWKKSELYGTFDKNDLTKLRMGTSVSFAPYGLDADTLLRKQREAYLSLYLNPSMFFRHLKSVRYQEDFSRIFKGLMGLIRLKARN